jgi:hypothetical protein
MIGFCALVFVVIVAFETQSELARLEQAGEMPADGSGVATGTNTESVSLFKRVKEYYRTHDLPRGWTVAGVVEGGPEAATVRIAFLPSPQDPRYGQSAPAEDVANGSFCPKPAEFWHGAERALITVELNDKTGAFKTVECVAPGTQ